MNTNNEETILDGMENKNTESTGATTKKGLAWKTLTMGGTAAILVGAGAVYGAKAMSDGGGEEAATDGNDDNGAENAAEDTSNVAVADVSDGQSFSDAFAQARAEVGPGGVFHWNGGVYGTYYADEWNAMSAEEKQQWAESVKPEYSVDRVDTAHISDEHPDIDAEVAEVDIQTDDTQEPHGTVEVEITEATVYQVNDDGSVDVHRVGYLGNEDAIVDGKAANVAYHTVDGHNAAVVDYYDQEEHDVAIVDLNDNAEVDDGEMMDLNTGDLLAADGTPLTSDPCGCDDVDMADNASFDSGL